MPAPIASAIRARIVRFLLLGWRPEDIAPETNCDQRTVYTIRECMFMYGSPLPPRRRTLGAPRLVTVAAEKALGEYIADHPWAQQN
jgi:hypothetical protein